MRAATWVPVTLLILTALGGCLGGGNKAASVPTATVPGGTKGVSGTLTVDFSFSPATPAVGDLVQFADESVDTAYGIVERAWDFGDHTAITGLNPNHTYAALGVYNVTLRVKNEIGNVANATRVVPVHAAAPAPGPGGDGPKAPTGFLSFATPVTVQASNGGEPSLAVDSKGRFWVSPIGSLYRSADEGKTFQNVNYPVPVGGLGGALSFDSHVAVDADDGVWVADLNAVATTSVWSSTDQGATWKGNPLASVTPVNDRQWVAPKGGGTAYLLYREVLPLGSAAGGRMTKTTDGGLTWLPLTQAFEWTSYPFVNPRDGTLYVVESAGTDIKVQVSTDGGGTWTSKRAADRRTDTATVFVNGAVDDAGNAYVAWSDKDASQFNVYMAYSTDRGGSWKGPVLVSAGVGTHIFPWIAAGGDGKVVVAWYGTDVVKDPEEMPATAEWYVYAAQSLNANAAQPVFAESRASPGPVHRGTVCVSGLDCDLGDSDADRDLLDFFMVQAAPDGRAAIAYADDTSTGTAAKFVLQSGGPLNR